jgi:hypothetical protein
MDTVNKDQKIRLSEEDFELLLPGKVITIGKSQVTIKPLSIEKLKDALRRLNAIGGVLTDAGVTMANYSEGTTLFKMVEIILEKAPELLSDVSNIALEDLLRLPLVTNTAILNTVLEINIESQQGLEKNLQSLVDMIGLLQSGSLGEKPVPEAPVQEASSNDSLKKGTPGKKSKRTRRGN